MIARPVPPSGTPLTSEELRRERRASEARRLKRIKTDARKLEAGIARRKKRGHPLNQRVRP